MKATQSDKNPPSTKRPRPRPPAEEEPGGLRPRLFDLVSFFLLFPPIDENETLVAANNYKLRLCRYAAEDGGGGAGYFVYNFDRILVKEN